MGEQAVRIWRDLMPSWLLPRGQLVLLPCQHVLCFHRCRLPLRCQEGPAHEDGQEQAVRIWRDLMANWFCCPDNMYCAATAADCPFVAKKAQLMKLAKSKQCGSGETSCPAGCCPEANWFCCPDNMYCAATSADCPFRAVSDYLSKLAKLN